MKLIAALLMLAVSAFAEPQKALMDRLLENERRLLGAVFADRAKSAEFAQDAQAVAADPSKAEGIVMKWRAETASFAQKYSSSQHPLRQGKTLREMAEPAEWAYLMQTLRLMEPGWMKDTVIGMIESAEADLKQGDPEKAEKFIKMARGKATDDIKEYQEKAEYKKGLAEAQRRREEAARKAKEEADRKVKEEADRKAKEEADRKAKEEADRLAKKPAPAKPKPQPDKPKKPQPEPEVVRKDPTPPPSGGESAREQLEAVQGRGGSKYDGGGSQADQTLPVDARGGSGAGKSPAPALQPSGERPNLTVAKEPPAPEDDDMAELKKMKRGKGGVAGIVQKWAPVGGAVLGGLIGLIFGGPIGLLIGAAVGLAVGYGASKIIGKATAAKAAKAAN